MSSCMHWGGVTTHDRSVASCEPDYVASCANPYPRVIGRHGTAKRQVCGITLCDATTSHMTDQKNVAPASHDKPARDMMRHEHALVIFTRTGPLVELEDVGCIAIGVYQTHHASARHPHAVNFAVAEPPETGA